MGLLSWRKKPHKSRRKKPHKPTLSDELQRLEQEARSARLAAGFSYSRAVLATVSRVPEDALAAWIDQGIEAAKHNAVRIKEPS